MSYPIKVSINIVAIVTIFMIYIFNDIYSKLSYNIKKNANQQLTNETTKIYQEIDNEINNISLNISLMTKLSQKMLGIEKIQNKKMLFYMKTIPMIKELTFIPIRNSDNYTKISKNSISSSHNFIKESFKKHKDNSYNKAFVDKIYYNENNELMLDIYANIVDINTNEFISLIIAKVSLKRIQDIVSSKLLEFDGVSLLDLNNNKFLYQSSKAKNINFDDKKHSSIISYVDYKYDNINIRISIVTSKERLYKETNEMMLKNIYKILLIMVIIAFLLFIIIKSSFKPLISLTKRVKKKLVLLDDKIEINDIDKDEIKQLDYYFNIFIDLIELRNKELQDLNKTLKIRVKNEIEKNNAKQKQLMHQSRLAQMGEMLSMIAHQWRQPLSAISATTSSLYLKSMMNKYEQEYFTTQLTNISNYSQHLSSTIDDFRNFFKKNKEKKEIKLCTLFDDALRITQTSLENKNIKIIKEYNSCDYVITYPNELRQVMLNLIKNAEDALIENKIENKYIKLSTEKENNKYTLIITDNAGGIDKDVIDKIFEPYYSTKTNKDGTGLGLYMSKTIVEEHCKGKLSASNGKDGAVFKVEI
ncbi:MAG: HAMP domain-containing sensor histidine kinase [Campylobacterota bacterium]|nr:HAMP domain-containing sensor histidine kinase [Campylobacterota bacterium]